MPPVMTDSRLYKQLAVLVLCVHYSARDKRKNPKMWISCPSASQCHCHICNDNAAAWNSVSRVPPRLGLIGTVSCQGNCAVYSCEYNGMNYTGLLSKRIIEDSSR